MKKTLTVFVGFFIFALVGFGQDDVVALSNDIPQVNSMIIYTDGTSRTVELVRKDVNVKEPEVIVPAKRAPSKSFDGVAGSARSMASDVLDILNLAALPVYVGGDVIGVTSGKTGDVLGSGIAAPVMLSYHTIEFALKVAFLPLKGLRINL